MRSEPNHKTTAKNGENYIHRYNVGLYNIARGNFNNSNQHNIGGGNMKKITMYELRRRLNLLSMDLHVSPKDILVKAKYATSYKSGNGCIGYFNTKESIMNHIINIESIRNYQL